MSHISESEQVIKITVNVPEIIVGIVQIEGCENGQSPDGLWAEILSAIEGAQKPDPEGEIRRGLLRNMLRNGRYKPTGRGKPASEYLVRAATEGSFPRINVLADINNLVSLVTRFPISIVDWDLAATDSYVVRLGTDGESYVFNPSGQELDLGDLLLVAALPEDKPLANPVKDCQATKTSDQTTKALGILYGTSSLALELSEATSWMASLVSKYTKAKVVSWVQGS